MTNVHFTTTVIFADFGQKNISDPNLRILQFWNLKVMLTSDLFQPDAEVVSQM